MIITHIADDKSIMYNWICTEVIKKKFRYRKLRDFSTGKLQRQKKNEWLEGEKMVGY